jgi:hypothetical protein
LFTAAAAVFVEVAKRRTLRDIKLAADAMPYRLCPYIKRLYKKSLFFLILDFFFFFLMQFSRVLNWFTILTKGRIVNLLLH